METFGLFHFLQSLLSQNVETPQKETPQEPTSPPQSAANTPEPTLSVTSSQEAALDFLSRHEARAKRLKKK